jgi:hypothetical protein
VVENEIDAKVSIPNYIAFPTGLKVGCIPTMNILWLDSNQKLVHNI